MMRPSARKYILLSALLVASAGIWLDQYLTSNDYDPSVHDDWIYLEGGRSYDTGDGYIGFPSFIRIEDKLLGARLVSTKKRSGFATIDGKYVKLHKGGWGGTLDFYFEVRGDTLLISGMRYLRKSVFISNHAQNGHFIREVDLVKYHHGVSLLPEHKGKVLGGASGYRIVTSPIFSKRKLRDHEFSFTNNPEVIISRISRDIRVDTLPAQTMHTDKGLFWVFPYRLPKGYQEGGSYKIVFCKQERDKMFPRYASTRVRLSDDSRSNCIDKTWDLAYESATQSFKSIVEAMQVTKPLPELARPDRAIRYASDFVRDTRKEPTTIGQTSETEKWLIHDKYSIAVPKGTVLKSMPDSWKYTGGVDVILQLPEHMEVYPSYISNDVIVDFLCSGRCNRRGRMPDSTLQKMDVESEIGNSFWADSTYGAASLATGKPVNSYNYLCRDYRKFSLHGDFHVSFKFVDLEDPANLTSCQGKDLQEKCVTKRREILKMLRSVSVAAMK